MLGLEVFSRRGDYLCPTVTTGEQVAPYHICGVILMGNRYPILLALHCGFAWVAYRVVH
jgi:hypothetical protein